MFMITLVVENIPNDSEKQLSKLWHVNDKSSKISMWMFFP